MFYLPKNFNGVSVNILTEMFPVEILTAEITREPYIGLVTDVEDNVNINQDRNAMQHFIQCNVMYIASKNKWGELKSRKFLVMVYEKVFDQKHVWFFDIIRWNCCCIKLRKCPFTLYR